LLENGLQSPHKLLNEYVKVHTFNLPGDTGEPHVSEEGKVNAKVNLTTFDWDRLRNGMLACLFLFISS
jgi:hypothetical protein